MKLHPYNQFSEEFNFEIYEKASALIENVSKKYNPYYLELQKNKLSEILKYGDIKGKNILDLGCGAINSRDNYSNRATFQPWLSRILYETGANVIGIDYGDLSKEPFVGYSLDLTKDKLDFLKTNSIDIASANALFDSPSLHGSSKKLFNKLEHELERIVKPEGIFIFENFCL